MKRLSLQLLKKDCFRSSHTNFKEKQRNHFQNILFYTDLVKGLLDNRSNQEN